MLSKDLEIALGSAVREARQRHHEFLSLEHLLFAIALQERGEEIIKACGGDPERLRSRINAFFDTHIETVSDDSNIEPQPTVALQRVLQQTVLHVQSAGKETADIGDLLAAIMTEEDSYAVYFLTREGISRLNLLEFISHGVTRDHFEDIPSRPQKSEEHPAAKPERRALENFTVNLIEKAATGKIDPLIGREAELERAMQVLCRRRKNNPIFVGDPGVGKTALAEGLARKIMEGDVPELLRDASMYALDMGSLVAGTKYRGEFEARLKDVITELKKQPKSILVIDEIHTVVGAGATSGGSLDASNILKPALASGDIRCIGSTTFEEFKKFFEQDRALSRRFQKIEIAEPSIKETEKILRGLKDAYEEHHHVRYTQGALKAAAELSARHITERYLPDKAIDVIDEAASHLRLSRKRGDKPDMITMHHIEKVVARIARVPIQTISRLDQVKLENLETELQGLVFGQDNAISQLAKAIKRSWAGLTHPEHPIGSFLFTGPTGVGKTELARQTAQVLGINFLRFDMSEYMEKHAVARLIGAPPGYVGFDQGGLLTDAVRRHPYCVLLLDEIEKAHPDLFSILLQVMDYAILTDNTGRKADFRHVILVMTSNVGAREIEGNVIGFGTGAENIRHKSDKAVKNLFSPEFRNRLDAIVPFGHLSPSVMEQIVDKLLMELQTQLRCRKLRLEITHAAKSRLAEQGYSRQFGARPLARLIQEKIKDPLAEAILAKRFPAGKIITIDVKDGNFVFG